MKRGREEHDGWLGVSYCSWLPGTSARVNNIAISISIFIYLYLYTGCPRRNGQNFGRVFLMLNYNE